MERARQTDRNLVFLRRPRIRKITWHKPISSEVVCGKPAYLLGKGPSGSARSTASAVDREERRGTCSARDAPNMRHSGCRSRGNPCLAVGAEGDLHSTIPKVLGTRIL